MRIREKKRNYYKVIIEHFYRVKYIEDCKSMSIEIDLREPYFEFSLDIITHWDPPYEKEIITDKAKRIILQNLIDYLTKQFPDKNVYFE